MRIRNLELLTNDLDATVAFYTEVPELEYAGGSALTAVFRAGESLLTFIYTETVAHPVYHFAFTLPGNKLQEALMLLSERVSILPLPQPGLIADFSDWNARAFYFQDNNGNILEFIVRYDLEDNSEYPFSGKSIRCISEAGIVTKNVTALAARLSAGYGIPVFSRQPPKENFTVMGDDHGLLILSSADRHWYPTDITAQAFPVRLIMAGKLSGEQLFQYGYE